MTYRLPLRIKTAKFSNRPSRGFCAAVSFTLPDDAKHLFPQTWPDLAFELMGDDATAIMETGRNGVVLVSLKAETENPMDWRMMAVTPAA